MSSETSHALDASSGSRIDREVNSCCQFCQVRCTTIVQIRNDHVVNVYGNPDNKWTDGAMCPKGQSLVELTYSPHRLLRPLIRDGKSWKRIPYEKALNLLAQKIQKLKKSIQKITPIVLALFARSGIAMRRSSPRI